MLRAGPVQDESGRTQTPPGREVRLPPDQAVAVAVAGVLQEGGRVLLVRRSAEPYAGCWSLPGGKITAGEPYRTALIREMLEETNLEVEVTSLAGVVAAAPKDGPRYLILACHLRLLSGDLKPGDDAAEARWIPLAELRRLCLTPGLTGHLTRFGVLNQPET